MRMIRLSEERVAELEALAGITMRPVKRVRDAFGAKCNECSAQFDMNTNANLPWPWRNSQAMHLRGTGHKCTLFTLDFPEAKS